MSEAPNPWEKLTQTAERLLAVAEVQFGSDLGTTCAMCGIMLTSQDLDDPDAIYREVSSWVTGPKLQSPVLRLRTGRIAHKTCIEKLLDGEAPDQEPVPGLEDL